MVARVGKGVMQAVDPVVEKSAVTKRVGRKNSGPRRAVRRGVILITAVGVGLRVVGEGCVEQGRPAGDPQDETITSEGRAVPVPRLEDIKVERHLQARMRGQVGQGGADSL